MNKLNKDTFLIYAAQHYQNSHCTSITDFEKDCKRFVVARTLMRNYYKRDRIPIRLLLNHIVICSNTFGPIATVHLFFYYCEEELYPLLSAVFEFMQIMPIDINIKADPKIEHILRNM